MMEKSHWVKEEDSNDDEVIMEFLKRIKAPLNNPVKQGQIGVRFSAVTAPGTPMQHRIRAMAAKFYGLVAPLADERGFDIEVDKKYFQDQNHPAGCIISVQFVKKNKNPQVMP